LQFDHFSFVLTAVAVVLVACATTDQRSFSDGTQSISGFCTWIKEVSIWLRMKTPAGEVEFAGSGIPANGEGEVA
jgi:hypothetical protein